MYEDTHTERQRDREIETEMGLVDRVLHVDFQFFSVLGIKLGHL